MEQLTTRARQMSPPILFVECPHDGGHLWLEVNPRWYTSSRARPRDKKWCPDHRVQRDRYIAEVISTEQRNRARDYAELGPPTTKHCTNPNPTTHRPGAIFPAAKFYRRKGPKKVDGTHSEILYSWCKECTRVDAARRAKADKEHATPERKVELTRQHTERQRRYRDKRNAGRREYQKEKNVRLDATPFSKWLREYMKDTGLSVTEVAEIGEVHDKTLRNVLSVNGTPTKVMRSIVDQVGVRCGHPELMNLLYGD